MKKSVHVICAPPPSPNPGMATVDMAFFDLWQSWFPEQQIRFWRFFSETERTARWRGKQVAEMNAREAGLITYECLRGRLEEVLAADVIVYWGDFLHMAHYREQTVQLLAAVDNSLSPAAAFKLVDDAYFLKGAGPEVFEKTVAFGGNLLFNRASDYLDADYASLATNFLGRAHRVWMRDVFSAGQVNRLRNDWSPDHLGTDCALLMDGTALGKLPRRWPTRQLGRAGIFFHRNQTGRRPMLGFARTLCQRLKVRPFWLPWRVARSPNWGQRLFFPDLEFSKETCPPTVADLLDCIADCEFVITDTYHICVNAWRLGVPAVCIGEFWVADGLDVSVGFAGASRDKRWVFYSMNEALEFYVHLKELVDDPRRCLDRLAESLGNRPLVKFVGECTKARATAARADLLASLRHLFQKA